MRVNIAPGVSMLAVLSRLNYKPWYALAEYVDNSVQSMLDNSASLVAHDGDDYRLSVSIDIDTSDDGEIVIRDNAAGIALADFGRAFRAAQVPPDRSGLSEFGMGMKSASCWFAREWTVRTKVLGESVGHEVFFDIAQIVSDEVDALEVKEFEAPEGAHFTELVLRGLNHRPVGRGFSKIKQHLRDIYRVFLREGSLELRINGDPLEHTQPAILTAPFFRTLEGEPVEWTKSIYLELAGGRSVSGFAALREVGSTNNAGFSLFRRGRVIQGSGDEGYRPSAIFGAGNSYRSQRLFGELHLSGFAVSHTKDGFQWDDSEEDFLLDLRRVLDDEPLPLLRQAEGYRARVPAPDQTEIAREALHNTAEAVEANLPTSLPEIETLPVEDAPHGLEAAESSVTRSIEFVHLGEAWSIQIELATEASPDRWLTRSIETSSPGSNRLVIRLNTVHPFMIRFAERDASSIEVVLRLATAIVVGEVMARKAGVRNVGTVTRNIDRILTSALSGP